MLDHVISKARAGDPEAVRIAKHLMDQLRFLQGLNAAPSEESQRCKRVRQSGRHQVWRLSHAFEPGVAVRTICWFDPSEATVVVALFFADKASMGDVFYDSVGSRADQEIDLWIQKKSRRRSEKDDDQEDG